MERMTEELRNVKSIGYVILTPFWSQGIGTEAVRIENIPSAFERGIAAGYDG